MAGWVVPPWLVVRCLHGWLGGASMAGRADNGLSKPEVLLVCLQLMYVIT
jgi:hypothetical protein